MVSTATATNQKIGQIVQVIGSTFDVEFEEGHLPEIYNALKIEEEFKGVKMRVTGEVQQHLGGNRVRAVALGSTEGLYRGMKVTDSGSPVRVPVGRRRWGECSTSLANRSMDADRSALKRRGPFIASRRRSRNCPAKPNCSRPASRLSTCSPRSFAAARPVSSAGRVSARPLSCRN